MFLTNHLCVAQRMSAEQPDVSGKAIHEHEQHAATTTCLLPDDEPSQQASDPSPAPSSLQQARTRTEDVVSTARSFQDLMVPESLIQSLAAAGFRTPSPVQQAAIPLGRMGSDLIVQAKSGTGKTVVFSVICLERVKIEIAACQALILAPTREVAIQSEQVISKLAAGLPEPRPSCAAFVGGLSIVADEKRLRRLVHIAVGTPGRVSSLLQSGSLPSRPLSIFVLDEADSLLGESFYPDVTWIYDQLPKRKQVLAFSATYTPELLTDLEPLMKRPQRVMLCSETVSLAGVRQFYVLAQEQTAPSDGATGREASSAGQGVFLSKAEGLLSLLSQLSFHQAVVFCNHKPQAEWLATWLSAAGFPAGYLSGDRPQTERMEAMGAVRGFKLRVIVSTDVMARGVDLDRVNVVANLDVPYDAATYVHRVGRTGRFGSLGISVSYVTQSELETLQGYLDEAQAGQVVPLPADIPPDMYSFELGSDWEQQALEKLKQAPKAEAPSLPPPPTTKDKDTKKGGKGHGSEGQDNDEVAAGSSSAAVDSQQETPYTSPDYPGWQYTHSGGWQYINTPSSSNAPPTGPAWEQAYGGSPSSANYAPYVGAVSTSHTYPTPYGYPWSYSQAPSHHPHPSWSYHGPSSSWYGYDAQHAQGPAAWSQQGATQRPGPGGWCAPAPTHQGDQQGSEDMHKRYAQAYADYLAQTPGDTPDTTGRCAKSQQTAAVTRAVPGPKRDQQRETQVDKAAPTAAGDLAADEEDHLSLDVLKGRPAAGLGSKGAGRGADEEGSGTSGDGVDEDDEDAPASEDLEDHAASLIAGLNVAFEESGAGDGMGAGLDSGISGLGGTDACTPQEAAADDAAGPNSASAAWRPDQQQRHHHHHHDAWQQWWSSWQGQQQFPAYPSAGLAASSRAYGSTTTPWPHHGPPFGGPPLPPGMYPRPDHSTQLWLGSGEPYGGCHGCCCCCHHRHSCHGAGRWPPPFPHDPASALSSFACQYQSWAEQYRQWSEQYAAWQHAAQS